MQLGPLGCCPILLHFGGGHHTAFPRDALKLWVHTHLLSSYDHTSTFLKRLKQLCAKRCFPLCLKTSLFSFANLLITIIVGTTFDFCVCYHSDVDSFCIHDHLLSISSTYIFNLSFSIYSFSLASNILKSLASLKSIVTTQKQQNTLFKISG